MQTSKRHCMIVHAHYPVGETRVERQARALVAAGFLVDVVCLRDKTEPVTETIDGINVHRLPMSRHKKSGPIIQLLEYFSFFILAFLKVAVLHWQRRYNVVQVHNLPDFLVFSTLIPRIMGARTILDLHDLMPEFYAARFKTSMNSWPVRLVRWQEWISCRYADHVITVTSLWRETLIGRGVSPDKVSVVMNVADDRIFGQEAKAYPVAQTNDRFKLIYHGNLTERYGLDLLIKAVNEIRHQIPSLHLILHGGGEYRDDLEKLINQLGLQDNITFSTRFVPTNELPDFIRQADVGVVPYRRDIFTDGILPTKLMEYAALGMPVIAARTPAINAYFDSKMVEFFTPDDVQDLARCILNLHSDQKRLAELGCGIRKFGQQYNWAKLGAAYVALVQNLGTDQKK